MNNIERGWNDVLTRWPKSKIFKPLRDSYGMYGLNVVLDGQLGVFSVKVSTKQPMEASKRGVFLSCHAALCDHKVPIFILHNHVLWRIKPQCVLHTYAFRNWLHGALMLNFYTTDVNAEIVGSTDGREFRCMVCGRPVPDGSIRCAKCQEVIHE